MITLDDKQLKDFEKSLSTFTDALPFATRHTVNQMAFKAREFGQQNLRNKMTLRNKWTERSVMVNMTRQLNIRKQESATGSTEDYLATQEFGGVEVAGGKHGVAIPTSTASGEGDSARPRKKAVRAANQMRRIRLSGRVKARSRGQRNFLAVRQAVDSGRKFVFLDLQKHSGIYKVIGGKRKPKVRLMHDMSRKSVRIPATPWLEPAVKKVEKIAPGLYFSALKHQLKRQGLL